MGDWVIRMSIFAESGERHPVGRFCGQSKSSPCYPVVEQHQRFQEPEPGAVPEFTIETSYKTTDRLGNPAGATTGWRYVLKWKDNGQPQYVREYGFDTRTAAVGAAQRRANRIAHALLPVQVETYTPEV